MKLNRLREVRRNYSVWFIFDARRFVKYLKYALRPRESLMEDRISPGETLKRLVHEEHSRHKGHEFTRRTTAGNDARPAVPYHRADSKSREQLHHRRYDTSDPAGPERLFE